MDENAPTTSADPVALVGLGHVSIGPGDAGERPDPVPFLRSRKERKYMGLQDELAVVAAGRALESAGLAGTPLGDRTGLYLVVGHIPFTRQDADSLLLGYEEVNPLLTFRCLSNMPAYHISASFGLTGPYFVTYPGPAQFYLALEEAVRALATGRIDRALVGAVAHQRNFLVEHHHRRVAHPASPESLMDAAGVLVLERGAGAISDREILYQPHDPFEGPTVPMEDFEVDAAPFSLPGDPGAASLPLALGLAAASGAKSLTHRLLSRDGYVAAGRFVLP